MCDACMLCALCTDAQFRKMANWWRPRPHLMMSKESMASRFPSAIDGINSKFYSKKRVVRALTEDTINPSAAGVLLLGHNYLVSSKELLESFSAQYRKAVEQENAESRGAVCSSLAAWLELYRFDIFSNPELYNKVCIFARQQLAVNNEHDRSLRQFFEISLRLYRERKQVTKKQIEVMVSKSGRLAVPLESLNPVTLAEHLSMWASGLLPFPTSRELMRGSIQPFSNHFESLSKMVYHSLSTAPPTSLPSVAKLFLNTAVESANLFNFSTCHAIMEGFGTMIQEPGVYLENEEDKTTYDVLVHLFSEKDSFKAYHSLLTLLEEKACFIISPAIYYRDVKKLEALGSTMEADELHVKKVMFLFQLYRRYIFLAYLRPEMHLFVNKNIASYHFPLDEATCHTIAEWRRDTLGEERPPSSDEDSDDDDDEEEDEEEDEDDEGDGKGMSALALSPSIADVSKQYHGIIDPSPYFTFEHTPGPSSAGADFTLIDAARHEEIYRREFYRNTTPPPDLYYLNDGNRSVIFAAKQVTDPDTLESMGLILCFSSLSVTSEYPVNKSFKISGDYLSSEKELKRQLFINLPFLFRERQKSMGESVSPRGVSVMKDLMSLSCTSSIDKQLLSLEAASMCCRPHISSIFYYSKTNLLSVSETSLSFEKFLAYVGARVPVSAAAKAMIGALPDDNDVDMIQSSVEDVQVDLLVGPWISKELSEKTDTTGLFKEMRVAVVFCNPSDLPVSVDVCAKRLPKCLLFIFVSPVPPEDEVEKGERVDSESKYQVICLWKSGCRECKPFVKTSLRPKSSAEDVVKFVTAKIVNAERTLFRTLPSISEERDVRRAKIMETIGKEATTLDKSSFHSAPSFKERTRRASTTLSNFSSTFDGKISKSSGIGGPASPRTSSDRASSVHKDMLARRGTLMGGGGDREAAAMVREGEVIYASDVNTITNALRACFLPPSEKKNSSKSDSELQNSPALQMTLLPILPPVTVPMTIPFNYDVVNRICSQLEVNKDPADFIINPHLSIVQSACDKFCEDTANISTCPKYVLAGALKLWLIRLAAPVLPSSLYHPIVRQIEDGRVSPQSAVKLSVLLQSIPAMNLAVLERIIRMCSTISAGSLRASSSLSEQFAMLLLRPPNVSANVVIAVHHQKMIVQFLIDHWKEVFGTITIVKPTLTAPLLMEDTRDNRGSFSSICSAFDELDGGSLMRNQLAANTSDASRADKKELKDSQSKWKQRRRTMTRTFEKKKEKLLSSSSSCSGASLREVGDFAQSFSLRDHSGQKVAMKEMVSSGYRTVLFFFKRDDASQWKRQCKLFRANYNLFASSQAQIFGISTEDANTNSADVNSLKLPYKLLSDPVNRVREKFGVSPSARTTFVLDEFGYVVHSFQSNETVVDHIIHALYGLTIIDTNFYYFTKTRCCPSDDFESYYDLLSILSEVKAGENGNLNRKGTGISRMTKSTGDIHRRASKSSVPSSFSSSTNVSPRMVRIVEAEKEELELSMETEEEENKSKKVDDWEVNDVLAWLRGIECEELVPLFEENVIKGSDLLEISQDDLQEDMELTSEHPLFSRLVSELNDLRIANAKRE